MKLVTAIIKPFKLDDVKAALEAFGVQGMTVSEVERVRPPAGPHRGLPGRGVHRRPRAEGPHRGPRRTTTDAEDVVDVIVKSAQTGRIGDGKVWTVPVDDVVRVRTGERGADAL